LLWEDRFGDFVADREARLLALISKATGHQIVRVGAAAEEGEDVIDEEALLDAPPPIDEEMEAA
jgi:hypothetical protein